MEVGRVADTVEAGYTGYDDDVAPARKQGRSGAETQLLDLVVDAEVFFDICVSHRQICLRLIVVVIGNEVLDGVVREERLELAVQLCGEGLVVAQDQSRALKFLDDVRHSESLARAGHTEERDGVHSAVQSGAYTLNRCGLVARWPIFRINLKFHNPSVIPDSIGDLMQI